MTPTRQRLLTAVTLTAAVAVVPASVLLVPRFMTPPVARAADTTAAEAAPFTLNKGDRVAIVGNTLPDRMQHDGWLETLIYAKFPQADLVFRNIAASADEVSTWHRSENFGSRDDWLTKVKADVVFAFYGFNESFKGDQGLPQFKADLDKFIKDTQAKKYGGLGKPTRVVLFSPIAAEPSKDPNRPDVSTINANLKKYAAAMQDVARVNNVPFVDLFSPSQRLYEEAAAQNKSLTIDGLHLTQDADAQLAPEIFRSLFGESAPEGDHEKLRKAIVDRNWEWHTRYRTVDGYNVYGGRSAEAYQPDKGGYIADRNAPAPYVSNWQIMQGEMNERDLMTANRDKVVWAAAQGKDEQPDDSNVKPEPKVATNHPGPNADKSWNFLGGEEAISKMTLAKGCKVNLFASEEQFPELIKPVQMAWDTKGRLWVSAWRNYPERTPDSKVGDSILIFEDTNGDGKADKVTHFIDDLNCPTGFQFYKDGLLLMQAPDLWYVHIGPDGKAGKVERVIMGMDSADSHHTTNSMVLDPGGATYLSDGIFHRTQVETAEGPVRNVDAGIYRYEPRTGKFERYAPYNFANPHGRVFDYWGTDIITDATGNNSYFGPAFSGHLDYPMKAPSYQQFWDRPSRPCAGTTIVSSRQFPDDWQGNFLDCNVISFQGIYRVKVAEEGSGIKGTTIDDSLVSSTDPNFRPVQVNCGPDGAIYFSDWQNPLIGHLQHHLRDPNRDHQHGRIYRITYEGRPLLTPPKIDGQPVAALLDVLKTPEDYTRTLAKIELGKHEASEVIPAVDKWAASLDKNDPAYEHHVTEALWVHQWMNVVDEKLLKERLRSPEPHARAAATRVLCYWRDRVPEALALLKVQATDESPRVRLEAVRACSFFRDPVAAEVALSSLKYPTDYYLDYCLKETMRQLEPYWRKALAEGKFGGGADSAALGYLTKGLGTTELMKLPQTPPVLLAILGRPDVTDADRNTALVALAAQQKTNTATALITAVEGTGNNAVAAASMAKMLPAQPTTDLMPTRDRLLKLAASPAPDVRQPALAAIAAADNSFDKIYGAAGNDPAKLVDVLSAVPLVYDQDLRATMTQRVMAFLAPQLPAEITGDSKAPGVRGRYVRISLPHPGTLSLAEVQVFSNGQNVATSGKAKQSSTAFNGSASRAIDGKTDGAFGSNTITHTKENDKKPWWEVDLGDEKPIESVVVWNRSENNGQYASRLDGYTLEVLDAQRQPTFKKEDNAAPAESGKIAVSSDAAGSVRRAAIRAAVSLQENTKPTFAALVALIEKGDEVNAAARGVRALPRKAWDAKQAADATQAIIAWAKPIPAGERTTPEYVETVQLAEDLAGLLPADQASSVRKELKTLRVSVFVVNTVREQMRYDTPRLVVEAGKPFEVIFQNNDFMPHNFVIVRGGSRPEIGAQTLSMKPDDLDSQGRPYVPKNPNVLTATKLVEAGQKARLTYNAPNAEGEYEYVCTFPGHWETMWGKLIVTKDVDAYLAAHPDAGPTGGAGSASHNHQHPH